MYTTRKNNGSFYVFVILSVFIVIALADKMLQICYDQIRSQSRFLKFMRDDHGTSPGLRCFIKLIRTLADSLILCMREIKNVIVELFFAEYVIVELRRTMKCVFLVNYEVC